MGKRKNKDLVKTPGSTRSQCRADEPTTSATHPERKVLKEDNDQRFVRLFRETIGRIPKNVIEELKKRQVGLFLRLLPVYDDHGREITNPDYENVNRRNSGEMIIDNTNFHPIDDEGVRGLIAMFIAMVYLRGHVDNGELDKLTAKWGFTRWAENTIQGNRRGAKTMNQI